MATQGTETVLDDTEVHDHDGVMTHTTMALPMAASDDNPVDVSVEFLGFGIDKPFTGPIGDMETAQVVPEFGTIATPRIIIAIVVPNSGTTCASSMYPIGPVNGLSIPNPRNSTLTSTGLSSEAAIGNAIVV